MTSMLNISVARTKVGAVTVRRFYQVASASGGAAKWKKGDGPATIRPGESRNFVVDATHKVRVYRNEGGFQVAYPTSGTLISRLAAPGPNACHLQSGTTQPVQSGSNVVTSGAGAVLAQNDPLTATQFNQLATVVAPAGEGTNPFTQGYSPPTTSSYRTDTAGTVTTIHPATSGFTAFDFNDPDSYVDFTGT